MERLNNFFLSNVLKKKVYDEYGDYIGKLWDIYVTTEDGLPRVIGYKIRKDHETCNYEFRNISFYKDNKNIAIKIVDAKEIIPRTYTYLLSKHLLDKEIVDINGKKVVRVNDLRLAEIAAEIRVVAVDVGSLARARRYGFETLLRAIYKMFKHTHEDSLVTWDNVESLEMVNDNLQIAVPYQKLSKLHPADLADILENMDSSNRIKVFERLEENLAADTLEEIETEYQIDLLGALSEDKAAELLDNMPNDEIADILEEMDEETAEKILLTIEKEDAEEIRVLMNYEDELVGSIMNKDFISFNVNITCEETIELLRELQPDDEVAYYIYIVDQYEKLQGVISLRDLIVSPSKTRLKEIMKTKVVLLRDSEKIESAVEMAVKYDLLSLPVLDKDDKLCGVVIMSDIVDEVLVPTWRKKFRKTN